jgi:hypothetical protein
MRLAKLAAGSCAALALAATALDTEAGRGRSGGRSHAASGGSAGHHHQHFHHGGTRVFIGGSFVAWPPAYYWPGYYYAPAVAGPAAYWYYCAAVGAYYPYVQNCPGAWELVLPTAPPYTGY